MEARGWLAAAWIFSLGLAWRDSETLQFFDTVATIVCFTMAAVSLAQPDWRLASERVRDLVLSAARVLGSTMAGLIPPVMRAAPLARGRASSAGGALRAVTVTVVLVLVFGTLLISADPVFANLIAIPVPDFQVLISHAFLIGFFAWIVAGGLRAGLREPAGVARPDGALPFTVGMLDVTLALGALDALFGLFIAAQLAWFFGGEAYLQTHTGLTASAYARRGFFELAWVAILIIPVLLVSRAALPRDVAVRRRHTALALPLVALLCAMVVSAALRMRLYVEYFGLTTDRFFTLVIMSWLGVVLLWLTATALRDRGGPFVAGAMLSGLATLAALNVVNPDAVVARVNLSRAGARPDAQPVDLAYLAWLSGETTAAVGDAVIAAQSADVTMRCNAAQGLLRHWTGAARARRNEGVAAWRSYNAGRARGEDAVAARARALWNVTHEACPAARAKNPAAVPQR
jgi:hypothetical protein